MNGANPRATVLVVDDSPDMLEVLERNLASEGYRVLTAAEVARAVELLAHEAVDLVVTDLKMPRVSGLDLVRHVRQNLPHTAVMMITGHATVESAVQAVKSGAEEYLCKPFTDGELLEAVDRALETLRRRRAARPGGQPLPLPDHGLIGESPAMQSVLATIPRLARAAATVLISGESGTGKELAARAIHRASPRASGALVPVNCGAIPGELFESELFGHVRGAYTGAAETREGLLAAADGGSLLLDEVSELSQGAQVKLLRVLEDGEVWKVGSDRPRRVDVRVLAASNRQLGPMVEAGKFREDLYFRLRVLSLELPPLRERGDDVVLLARHFADRFAEAEGKPSLRFSEQALQALQGYAWPGNVRELQNLMQQLVVMGEGPLRDVTDLPLVMRFSVAPGPHRTLAQMEAEYVRDVLASVGGNKTRAARILGINRKTLREKLKL